MEKILLYTDKDLQDLTMDMWLRDKVPSLQAIALQWFQEIKNCGEDVQDIFHDGHPVGCVNMAPFAYVDIFSHHVHVGFFYGASLDNKRGILEGTGKRMRHIKLKPGSLHDDKEISTLIHAAYADIKRRLNERGL